MVADTQLDGLRMRCLPTPSRVLRTLSAPPFTLRADWISNDKAPQTEGYTPQSCGNTNHANDDVFHGCFLSLSNNIVLGWVLSYPSCTLGVS